MTDQETVREPWEPGDSSGLPDDEWNPREDKCRIVGPYLPVGDTEWTCRTHGVSAVLVDESRAGAADIKRSEVVCPVAREAGRRPRLSRRSSCRHALVAGSRSTATPTRLAGLCSRGRGPVSGTGTTRRRLSGRCTRSRCWIGRR